ncbi:hypothetical protein [Duganella sp. Root1480D1]|uniref:hypothetical protein n=1 Tax=Duganella sp. Root1480D1 TaxID=1736471 RepID=UPI0012E3D6C7|nr:hypothetical protein [Duganella sp. Root1480D1]
MTKPKRYPRARSALHARFLSSQGLPVRKPFHNEWIGPATPTGLIELLRNRYVFDDEMTSKVLGLLNSVASGRAIKCGNKISMIPAGPGKVMIQLRPREIASASAGFKARPLAVKGGQNP